MNIVSELTLSDLQQTVGYYKNSSSSYIKETWSLWYPAKHINFQVVTALQPNGNRVLISSPFLCLAPQDLQDTTRVDMHQELLNGGFDKLKNAYMLRPILPSKEATEALLKIVNHRKKEKDVLDKLTLMEFKENTVGGGNIQEEWHFAYNTKKAFLHVTTTVSPTGERIITSTKPSGNVAFSEIYLIKKELLAGGFRKFKADYEQCSVLVDPEVRRAFIEKQPTVECKLCNGSGRRIMFQNEVECDCVLAHTGGKND